MSNQEGKKYIKSSKGEIVGEFKTRKVSIDEKIEIFERFFRDYPDKVLDGNTVYEGYPIGHWAIQIRSKLKKDVEEEKEIKLTEEQWKKLDQMGILDRQLGSTIDEKIQELVDWSEDYPMVEIALYSRNKRYDCLKRYVTEEELESVWERYELMQIYYQYVIARRARRKINPSTRNEV